MQGGGASIKTAAFQEEKGNQPIRPWKRKTLNGTVSHFPRRRPLPYFSSGQLKKDARLNYHSGKRGGVTKKRKRKKGASLGKGPLPWGPQFPENTTYALREGEKKT